MPRRNRTNSIETFSHKSPAKTRGLSSSAKSNLQADSFGSQGKLWKVRDIVNENRTHYLIDWEDDLDTGEKYKPTWEPKAYANAETVAAWKQKLKKAKRSKAARQSSFSSPQVTPGKDRPAQATPRFRTSRRRRVVKSSSPTKTSQESHATSTQETSQVEDNQLPQSELPSSDQQVLRVEITPHSSLDPEQYRIYLASQSIQAQASQQDQADSGFDESSSISASPQYPGRVRSDVVPDSQSLPNSSSYQPPEGRSSPSVIQASGEDSRGGYLRPRRLLGKRSYRINSTAGGDPIEDIASSQDLSHPSFDRSRNFPESLVIEDSSRDSKGLNSSSQLRDPLRGSSPKAAVLTLERQEVTGNQASSRLEIAALSERTVVSTVSEPDAIGTSGIGRPSADISSNANLDPESIQLALVQDNSDGHSTHCIDFQTQLPLPFDDCLSELTSESPSTPGEIWQSTQHRTAVASVQSERSSVRSAEHLSKHGDGPTSGHTISSRRASLSDQSTQDSKATYAAETFQSSHLLHSVLPKEDVALISVEPPDLMPEEVTSSISLVAPSQLPTVLDSNPPQRLSTPSDVIMSDDFRPAMGSLAQALPPRDSPVGRPAPSLREKLRNMRAASAAEALARRQSQEPSPAIQGTKSPSIIPEPSPKDEVGNSRMEVRAIDVPRPQRPSGSHTPINPSKLHLHKEVSQLPTENALQRPKLDLMEYVVPLPLPARVKDQYMQLLDYYKAPIRKFKETIEIDDTTTNTIQTFISRLNHVTTHIDLDNDTTLTQQDVTPEMQVMWAIDSSAKFQFLQHLINFMRGEDCHLVIVAEGGRLLDLLEVFLQGIRVDYIRPDIATTTIPSNVLGRMQISLLTTGEFEPSNLLKPPTVVIAFDASFDCNNPDIKAVRNISLSPGQYVPVVHLLVYASAEHIIRCMSSSVQGRDRLKAIVDCVLQNSDEVGKLSPDEYNPQAAAEEVAAFVKGGSLPHQWTVFPIRALAIDLTSENISRQISASIQPEVEPVTEAGNNGKRPLSSMETKNTPPKRQRMTPGPDVTHISDSMIPSTKQSAQVASQIITDLQCAIRNAQNDIEELKVVHNKRENELQTTLRDTKQQLQDHVHALNALQDRYEERNTQYHTLRHENNDLLTGVVTSDRRRDALIAENTKLREERKLVDEALVQARNALLSSPNPQISHLESLSAANRALLSEKDVLAKRLASMTRDFDFTREQYQLASSAAAEATSRLSELETLNETLAKKASGEIAKAKTMTVQIALAQQGADVERLESENREMRELLRRKERGRGVVTRTGSVAPKSPRMGGNSPGRSRQGSRAPGSRGVSPVRGFLGVRKGRGPVD